MPSHPQVDAATINTNLASVLTELGQKTEPANNQNALNWPMGTPFTDRRTLTADGSGGDLAVRIQPATSAASDEFMLIGGRLQNTEVATRTGQAYYTTSAGVVLLNLWSLSITAGNEGTFLTTTANGGLNMASGAPLLVSGTDQLEMRALSVTLLDDFIFNIVLRLRGSSPTITEVIA